MLDFLGGSYWHMTGVLSCTLEWHEHPSIHTAVYSFPSNCEKYLSVWPEHWHIPLISWDGYYQDLGTCQAKDSSRLFKQFLQRWLLDKYGAGFLTSIAGTFCRSSWVKAEAKRSLKACAFLLSLLRISPLSDIKIPYATSSLHIVIHILVKGLRIFLSLLCWKSGIDCY